MNEWFPGAFSILFGELMSPLWAFLTACSGKCPRLGPQPRSADTSSVCPWRMKLSGLRFLPYSPPSSPPPRLSEDGMGGGFTGDKVRRTCGLLIKERLG